MRFALLRPDGTQFPGSPFRGGGLPGPWAVVVDGNDNVWIFNFAMPNSPITQLCGARTENCPPGWIKFAAYVVFVALNSLWGGWFTVACIVAIFFGLAVVRDQRLGLH